MARGDLKIIEEAKKRFQRCQDWESSARRRFRDDMKFAEGDSDNGWQWDARIRNDRLAGNKPALTINKVRQHNLQIVNDARQNKPQVRVQPVGDQATADAARVFEGIVRHIEYLSDAQTAYDTATYNQVYGGIGYIRLKTGYLRPDTGFDQEIFIERVKNPLSVYLDPDIQRFDGSDARFGFVFDDLAQDVFEEKYPAAKGGASALGSDDEWHGSDYVRVAEYFRRVDRADTLFDVPALVLPSMPDGGEVRASEVDPEVVDLLRQYADAAGVQSRQIKTPIIEWFKIAGSTIVSRSIWPGAYIPIARVVGEETVIDGKLDRKGHTRALIDPQRMYNWWSSAAVEIGAMNTKSDYMCDIESIEGFEDVWEKRNVAQYAYLPYKSKNDAGQSLAPPTRVPPGSEPTACLSGMQTAANELMLASGQYQSEMGAPSNERSGVAINARQRQADNSTYHYVDHLAQAIRYIGRMLVDLIPRVYDTPRVLRILAEDGSESHVSLDPSAPQAHAAQGGGGLPGAPDASVIFNPNVGRYDVVADIGPAFATRRQEAFNAYQQIIAHNPDMVKMAGDLMFSNADFPGASDIAERLRRAVPPALLGDGADPQVKGLQQQLQQMHTALGNATAQMNDKQGEAAHKAAELALDQYRAETDRMKAVGGIDPQAMMPVIRELVSQVLGAPVVPVIAAHAAAAQAMAPGGQPPVPLGGASQPATAPMPPPMANPPPPGLPQPSQVPQVGLPANPPSAAPALPPGQMLT